MTVHQQQFRSESRRPAAVLDADHPCGLCAVRLQTFCGTLAAAELAAFKRMGSTARLRAGQPVFHEGDPADMAYNLTRGMVKLYKLPPDGRRQVTGFLHPGDFLGITVDDVHAFSAEAVESIEFCKRALEIHP